jgi:hypothetical protein
MKDNSPNLIFTKKPAIDVIRSHPFNRNAAIISRSECTLLSNVVGSYAYYQANIPLSWFLSVEFLIKFGKKIFDLRKLLKQLPSPASLTLILATVFVLPAESLLFIYQKKLFSKPA